MRMRVELSAGIGRCEKLKDGKTSIIFVYVLVGVCVCVWGQAAEWGRTFRLMNSGK